MAEFFITNKMTDFEKSLFLKREVKELKELLKSKDYEIGVLKSERDELEHDLKKATSPIIKKEIVYTGKYNELSPSQKRRVRTNFKDEVVVSLREQITILNGKVVRRNQRIAELEEQLSEKTNQ